MTALLLLAVLLTGAALWWLTRPLRLASPAVPDSERAELEQLRDRLVTQLGELDAERADRGVDSAVARDEELRLSSELAGVLKRLEGMTASAAAPASAPARASWPVVGLLALVLVVVGGGLYTWRNADNLRGFTLAARSGVDATRLPPMVFEMVKRLEQRLATQPNDPEGWARLGRAYSVLERRDDALAAYAKAYALAPNDIAVVSDYAWLVFNQDPSNTTGLAADLYNQLYKLEPKHPDALWFLGFSAYQQGEYRKALSYWEKLMKVLPAEDPGRVHLQQAIGAAREKLRR